MFFSKVAAWFSLMLLIYMHPLSSYMRLSFSPVCIWSDKRHTDLKMRRTTEIFSWLFWGGVRNSHLFTNGRLIPTKLFRTIPHDNMQWDDLPQHFLCSGPICTCEETLWVNYLTEHMNFYQRHQFQPVARVPFSFELSSASEFLSSKLFQTSHLRIIFHTHDRGISFKWTVLGAKVQTSGTHPNKG